MGRRRGRADRREASRDRGQPRSESQRTGEMLRPVTLGLEPSFGFGDRLGLATPGHIAAMEDHSWIQPIFAQQSIREMTRTDRSPDDVMQDALKAGWQGKQGADADHLKTKADVDRTS